MGLELCLAFLLLVAMRIRFTIILPLCITFVSWHEWRFPFHFCLLMWLASTRLCLQDSDRRCYLGVQALPARRAIPR